MTLNFTRQRQLTHALLDQMMAAQVGPHRQHHRQVRARGHQRRLLRQGRHARLGQGALARGRQARHHRQLDPAGPHHSEQIRRNYTPEYRKWQADNEIPVGRYGEPEDVAEPRVLPGLAAGGLHHRHRHPRRRRAAALSVLKGCSPAEAVAAGLSSGRMGICRMQEDLQYAVLHEFVAPARRNISRGTWDYLMGGAETETTYISATASRSTRWPSARACCATSRRSIPSGKLMGQKLRLPVILAPIGSLQDIVAAGGVAPTRAAAALRRHPHAELAERAGPGGRGRLQRRIPRSSSSTCAAMRRGWRATSSAPSPTATSRSASPSISTTTAGASATSPSATSRPRGGRRPAITSRPASPGATSPASRRSSRSPSSSRASPRPRIRAWRSSTASRASTCRTTAAASSTTARAAIDVLPEVVEAAGGRAEIIVDGGFMRGTDIVKAMALGANAVGIGRLQGLALAAGGEAAVVRALELLEDEVRRCLGLLGVTSYAELDKSYLAPARPRAPGRLGGGFPASQTGVLRTPSSERRLLEPQLRRRLAITGIQTASVTAPANRPMTIHAHTSSVSGAWSCRGPLEARRMLCVLMFHRFSRARGPGRGAPDCWLVAGKLAGKIAGSISGIRRSRFSASPKRAQDLENP